MNYDPAKTSEHREQFTRLFAQLCAAWERSPESERAEHIRRHRAMPYKSVYLKSQFWWIVSNYKIVLAEHRCTACGWTEWLEGNHLTYEHRGSEHLHLEDIEVLCRRCHLDWHARNAKTPEERAKFIQMRRHCHQTTDENGKDEMRLSAGYFRHFNLDRHGNPVEKVSLL